MKQVLTTYTYHSGHLTPNGIQCPEKMSSTKQGRTWYHIYIYFYDAVREQTHDLQQLNLKCFYLESIYHKLFYLESFRGICYVLWQLLFIYRLTGEECEGQEHDYVKKKERNLVQVTKKVGCTAHIKLKSLIRYPSFKVCKAFSLHKPWFYCRFKSILFHF